MIVLRLTVGAIGSTCFSVVLYPTFRKQFVILSIQSSNSTSVEELYTTESGTMLDYLTKNDKILLVSLESFLIVRIVSLPIKKIEVQIKI